jgi:hypothetical protein
MQTPKRSFDYITLRVVQPNPQPIEDRAPSEEPPIEIKQIVRIKPAHHFENGTHNGTIYALIRKNFFHDSRISLRFWLQFSALIPDRFREFGMLAEKTEDQNRDYRREIGMWEIGDPICPTCFMLK